MILLLLLLSSWSEHSLPWAPRCFYRRPFTVRETAEQMRDNQAGRLNGRPLFDQARHHHHYSVGVYRHRECTRRVCNDDVVVARRAPPPPLYGGFRTTKVHRRPTGPVSSATTPRNGHYHAQWQRARSGQQRRAAPRRGHGGG